MHDLIIIGAGPAGLTAALYAGRFRLDTLFLEKTAAGGQILLSPSIDNFPGFAGGVATVDLIDKFRQQAEEAGVQITTEEVRSIEEVASPQAGYALTTELNRYLTRTVIVATGAQPKRLGVEGEMRLTGKGVSYCATCDAPFFKNKEVVVIGGGDRAIEEAIFLTSYAGKVTVVHRRQQLRASAILQEKARSNPKIEFLLENIPLEITGEKRVEGLRVKNVKSGSEKLLNCQGVFIFVGILPNTGFLKGFIDTDEAGFILTNEDLETSKKNIFACGDCRKKSLYQVITACGEGATAAASAQRSLL